MFPPFYSRSFKESYNKKGDQLFCSNHVVPIINGIPRFVDSGSYASLFGDQWKKYTKTQLDSYTGIPISTRRLERCLGSFNDLNGKIVLEAGCGAGRFTEVILQKGAFLISSDISSAVEVNQQNFPINNKHLIVQADINNMPFQTDSFDIVICLGVIQHTPDPEVAIKNLYDLVKPGGYLIIDHYTFNKSFWFRSAPIYRHFLRRKSADITLRYTEKLVSRYLPLHKLVANSRILSLLLNRFSPVVSYYRTLPELNDLQQKEWALLDTHDSLTDYFKHFRSKRQILGLLQSFGAVDIWCEYGGNGVEARCQKPLIH